MKHEFDYGDMPILTAVAIVREFRKTLDDGCELDVALDTVCMAVDSVRDMLNVCQFDRAEFAGGKE